jgi:hypothetical protein
MEKEIRDDIKGINRFIFETGSDREQLHLHISEVGPGDRAHPLKPLPSGRGCKRHKGEL